MRLRIGWEIHGYETDQEVKRTHLKKATIMHLHAYAKKTAWIHWIHLAFRLQVQLKELTQFISGIFNRRLTQELPLPSTSANMTSGYEWLELVSNNIWKPWVVLWAGSKFIPYLWLGHHRTFKLVSFKVFISGLCFLQTNKPEMKDLKHLCHI